MSEGIGMHKSKKLWPVVEVQCFRGIRDAEEEKRTLTATSFSRGTVTIH